MVLVQFHHKKFKFLLLMKIKLYNKKMTERLNNIVLWMKYNN